MQNKENEYLIQQFLLEKGYMTGSYDGTVTEKEYQEKQYDLLKDKIDLEELEIWVKTKIDQSRNFGRNLKRFGLIEREDKIVELTTNRNFAVTSSILCPISRKLVYSQCGEGTIGLTPTLNHNLYSSDIKLVMSGIFQEQVITVQRFAESGHQIVAGFVIGENKKYNQRLVEYYTMLKNMLENFQTESMKEINIEKEGIYILTNRPMVFNIHSRREEVKENKVIYSNR